MAQSLPGPSSALTPQHLPTPVTQEFAEDLNLRLSLTPESNGEVPGPSSALVRLEYCNFQQSKPNRSTVKWLNVMDIHVMLELHSPCLLFELYLFICSQNQLSNRLRSSSMTDGVSDQAQAPPLMVHSTERHIFLIPCSVFSSFCPFHAIFIKHFVLCCLNVSSFNYQYWFSNLTVHVFVFVGL